MGRYGGCLAVTWGRFVDESSFGRNWAALRAVCSVIAQRCLLSGAILCSV